MQSFNCASILKVMKNRIIIEDVSEDKFNPFGAEAVELVALALSDNGLMNAETTLNGQSATEVLKEFFSKRRVFQEITRLGYLLIQKDKISHNVLQEALDIQKKNKDIRLGEILINMGACAKEDIDSIIKSQKIKKEHYQRLKNTLNIPSS